jgi:catechol 2,3-dioxygenase-like lactoylglutathione lyase family enzyme
VTASKSTSKTAGRRSKTLAPRALVPFAHVVDVGRSVSFYETLGFAVGGKLVGQDGTLDWVILEHEGAQLMVGRATAPVVAEEQAVLFYVYYQDVPAAHEALIAAGIEVGPIQFPPHSPRGEFRVTDPDGYGVQVTHT